MNKIKTIYKQAGFKGLIKRIFDKLLRILGIKENVYYNKKRINEIFDKNYKRIIIYENSFGWNKLSKQRSQQISLHFQSDTLFLYGTPYEEFFNVYQIDQLGPHAYLINLDKYRKIIQKKVFRHKKKYLMISSFDYIDDKIIKLYKRDNYGIIYDYSTDISNNILKKNIELLSSRKEEMLTKDNYVVCASTHLLEDVKSISKDINVQLVTNGSDNYSFHKKVGKEIKELEKYEDKTIIGYYGDLDKKIDYELLKELASNKDYIIVLCGNKTDKSLEKSGLLVNQNVKCFEDIEYEDLVNYGLYFDVSIIPFVVDDTTTYMPLSNLYQYIALGKPIVSTNLFECSKYKSVLVSKTNKDFINNIAKAKKLENNKKYLETIDREAKKNDWYNKCDNIISFLNKKPIKVNNTVYYVVKKFLKTLEWTFIIKPFTPIRKKLDHMARLRSQKKYDNELKTIFDGDYDRIVVWINNNFGWNIGLFQRPQHIALNMARNNTLYFYDASNAFDNCPTIKKQDENLYLINTLNEEFFEVLLNRIKKSKKPKYLNIYSTEMILPLSTLKKYKKYGFKILYEYIDDLSPEISVTDTLPKNIIDKYNYCMNDIKDSYIVVTADNIEKDVLRYRKKDQMTYACNGVDYNHFQVEKDITKVNNQMKKIVNKNKPIIGYYGALATWFDYDLIKYLAQKCPNCEIVLIGVEYDHSFKKQHLNDYKNIHFLGTIPYKELPNYAMFFTTCMIPFLINDITQATSPLKLFEYMAMHKPIITTPMHECKKYKSVMIANNKEEFVSLTNKSFKMTKETDKEYFDLLEKEAQENSWDKKSKIIIEYLSKYEKKGEKTNVKN